MCVNFHNGYTNVISEPSGKALSPCIHQSSGGPTAVAFRNHGSLGRAGTESN